MSDSPSEELPLGLQAELDAANALKEIVVLYSPTPQVLEAYAFEDRLGVIAVVPGGANARTAALETGALEVIDPALDEQEARVRIQTAVARFRSRLNLERMRDDLDGAAQEVGADLMLAARLQRSLLPQALPARPEVKFTTAYLPREFVSGDSYDVRELETDHLAIYTLDAVGHGVRAALLTVLLRSMFFPLRQASLRAPHEVVAELNTRLLETKLEESPTAAFCYGLLDVKKGLLHIANAGHPPPLVLRPNGTHEQLGDSGLLLGIQPCEYTTATVALNPNERLFFFTDGAEPNYEDAFAEQLTLHRNLDLEDQVGGALGSSLLLDEEGRPQDDVTVVAFDFRGPAHPNPTSEVS